MISKIYKNQTYTNVEKTHCNVLHVIVQCPMLMHLVLGCSVNYKLFGKCKNY